jgi:Mrp family chromosome partitioning ATPase
VAVYDKFIYDRLQYLLTLLGKTVIDNKGVKDFIYLVVETLQEAKRKREQVEKLEWEQVCEVCASISQHRMATVRHKYRPELYLQRSHAYGSFEKYLGSDKKVFVLVGKSGVGKSNFILSLADVLRVREEICVMMYDGAQLKVEPSMQRVIIEDFNERLTIGGKKVEDVWRQLGKVAGIEKKQVILFVDAINENPQARELLRQLDDLAQTPWSWLKIVFTCRPETCR